MPRKACKIGIFAIHKAGQKSTSIIKRWVLIFCEEFVIATSHAKWWKKRPVHGVSHSFTEVFHLLSHSIFLIWPHFYDKFLEKYICLIFLPHYHILHNFRILNDFLKEWTLRKEELKSGEITRDEYFEWKINWPQTCDDCGKREPSKQWRNLYK